MKTIPVSFLVAGMLLPAVCVAQPPPPADGPPPRGDAARREPLQAFIEAWKNADADHDGFISRSEFDGMPRIQNIPEEKRAAIFKRLDKDGDGLLSRDELMHFNRQYDGQPKKRLWELDLDRSGGIDLTEFRQGDFFKKLPPEKAAEVFQRLDTDGDGLITPKDKPEQPFKRPEGKPGKRPDGDGPGDGRDARHPEKLIQKLDANADGSLSFEEYRTGQGTKELTEDQQEDRFEALDKNGDHRISLEEFHPPSPRAGEEKN
jgi:Ca2+-binding EF-hand superfamily protein